MDSEGEIKLRDSIEIRDDMIKMLRQALLLCSLKSQAKRVRPAAMRIQWVRTLAYVAQSLNAVIKDKSLEDLDKGISELENKSGGELKNGVKRSY